MKTYTPKQMGDACEMLIAAELTLGGIPALRVPENWSGYDVVAQPQDGGPAQRISVKSRTFKSGSSAYVDYYATAHFDWLAVVLLFDAGGQKRRYFIIPKARADVLFTRKREKIRTTSTCPTKKL